MHLAGVTHKTGEEDPYLCWDLNIQTFCAVLNATKEFNLKMAWLSTQHTIGINSDHTNDAGLSMWAVSANAMEGLSE